MNSQEIKQRLDDLEGTMKNIQVQLSELERQWDEALSVQILSSPNSHSEKSLAQLEIFLVEQFPQLAQRLDSSIFIPGLTGNGEIGPGNEPMPKNHSGNTHIDPRKRTES